jgi:phosphocarrier protein FPr
LHADRLASLDDGTLASRATDLRDLGRRVVRLITGTGAARIVAPPGAIVVADDLTPSEAATLDRGMVLGFCTRGGGPTSHVAILARALGVPAVVAIDPRALDLADGTEAILDGAAGTLTSRPSGAQVSVAQARHQRDLARRTDDIERSSHPAVTLDGHRLQVLGNVGTQGEVEGLLAYGGDGVGLLRSEFLFVGRDRAPSEDEQASAYGAMAGVLGASRPLVVRTLDAGGDTPLDFVEVPRETNPSLGERGIRLGFEHPGLLRSQVRAVLRASAHGMVRVMFPMVARLAEWRAARALLEEEARAMGLPLVPAGIMVEVPAAALLADAFAREVDFFSLGTNDLAQYTLAMDRGHPMLAAQVDGLEPAVLQLIARTVEAARRHGRRVAVCGELAADPQAVPVLVGMGVDELSVGVAAIPEVKAMIRTLERRACEVLASRALAAGSAAEVRGLSPALRA